MNDLNHYRDFIKPSGIGWVITTLRVVVAAQCFGVALQGLQGDASSLSVGLAQDLGWSMDRATAFDRNAAWGMALCGVLTLLRPSWIVLLPVTAWMLAAAWVPILGQTEPSARLIPLEHAVCAVAPLALMLLDFWPPRLKTYLGRCFFSLWLMRLAVVATFVGIGLLALLQATDGGPLLDLVGSLSGRFDTELTDHSTRLALGVAGGVSLGLAVSVLLSRSRAVLLASGVWGLMLAFSHVLAGGPLALPEFLVRIAIGGVPLTMLLYYNMCFDHPKAQMIPQKHS